ncbi:MAG: dTDP-4-dehydrorhamnose reductase [Bacteroidales bacterium]
MAVILVTGANGQLGNELKEAAKNYCGYQFIFTDIDTLDITNKAQTEAFIRNTDPGWIINCAAYNLVDKAEKEQEKAMLINNTAVKNIADSASGKGCRLIQISSDYVFDGNSNVPYNEGSVPDPLNFYGKSKLEGEKAALLHFGSMVIRTSWLYSSFGANFVKTILSKGKENDTLKVVFDQTGTPTYAADLANAIMTIVSGVIRNQLTFHAGLYHYSNEGVCSWYDFATEIVTEAGLDCKIIPVLSKDYHTEAARPLYSVLDKTKIKETYNLAIPHWRSSLKKCIKLLK